MDLEARLEALENNARDQLASDMALHLLVRSLLITHPDPASVETVFSAFLAERVAAVKDHGFDKGYKSSTAHGALGELQKHADGWLFVLSVVRNK